MKNVYKGLFALVIAVLFLSSCSSDDDALPKKLIVDGQKLALSNGYIIGWGPTEDEEDNLISVYSVAFTTAGVTIEEGSFVGTGSYILVDLASPSSVHLQSGTYEINEDFLKNAANSFVAYNFDSEAGAEATFGAIAGTIKVTKSGTTYAVKFNVTMVNIDTDEEIKVTGSFEGKLVETYLSVG